MPAKMKHNLLVIPADDHSPEALGGAGAVLRRGDLPYSPPPGMPLPAWS